MTRFLHGAASAAEFLGIATPVEWMAVDKLYPVLANSYYLGLIDRNRGAEDPVGRQILPDMAELKDESSEFDPLAEAEQMIAPRMIRRFYDRVVVLVTAKCAGHCRFCFRKRLWKADAELNDVSDDELASMAAALKAHPEIEEVLLSGGDPMMLADERLIEIIRVFSGLEQIKVIRLGTRIPVMLPGRITDQLAEKLAEFDKLWVLTHFNHPNEVTEESGAACRKLISRGIWTLNQTVLLKGVNDSPEILEQLFRKLLAIKVKPHYLFHVDPVRGVRHFATGIEPGLEVLRYLRGRLSSLGTPTFAIDLPEGGGKVALQPNYEENGGFWDIHNKKLIKYPDKE